MARAQYLRGKKIGHDNRVRKGRPIRDLWSIAESLDFILKGQGGHRSVFIGSRYSTLLWGGIWVPSCRCVLELTVCYVSAVGVTSGDTTLFTHGHPLVELVARLVWFQITNNKVHEQFIVSLNEYLLYAYNVSGFVLVLKYIREQNKHVLLWSLHSGTCGCGERDIKQMEYIL